MASANTLCKKLLSVKTAVITGHDFYTDRDGVNHISIKARPNKWHENDYPLCHKRCEGYDGKNHHPRIWRGLNWGGTLVEVEYDVHRIECPVHGVLAADVPWTSFWQMEKVKSAYYHLRKFDKQYDEIVKTAYEENPSPETMAKKRGLKKKDQVLNLIGRLEKYKASVCLFIKDLCISFHNNQAGRDLRMVKVKTKMSGCFRSVEGAQE